MSWRLTTDIEEFLRAAEPYLVRDAVRNTVLLTVGESVRCDPGAAPEARFGWWRESAGGEVTGAFMETPPRPPYLGPMTPWAAAELARTLRAALSPAPVTGVAGVLSSATVFAEEWTGGQRSRGPRGLRLFRLGDLTPPSPLPEGRVRSATAVDVPLAARWMGGFAGDVGEPADQDYTAAAARRIEEGRLLFWEVDGVPVSMAGHTPLVAGQIRVAPVYTPAPLRGRGYAAGSTTAVSEAARTLGADEVVLFTDVANPTSNALYQRLGYRPVGDYAEYDLS